MHFFNSIAQWLWGHEITYTIIVVLGLTLVAAAVYWLCRLCLRSSVRRFILRNKTVHQRDVAVTHRIALLVAGIVFALSLSPVPGVQPMVKDALLLATQIYCTVGSALLLCELLNAVNTVWSKKYKVQYRSIKGYIQIAKIIVAILTVILIIAQLTGRPPSIILSGFGAAAAVLMLVFQHTLLSFVANIQVSSSKSINLHDWVEIPAEKINGEVIDIALHTVKIQNWDNTIARVPMRNFITESWINWQPMFSSGGRRIERSFFIDQTSISFVNEELLQELRALFPEEATVEHRVNSGSTNHLSMSAEELFKRKVTNLGLFRNHIMNYLKNRDDIVSDMYIVVRYLAPTSAGLPVEIYCFTSKVFWVDYEPVQAELSEYFYAIAQHFNLGIFQSPSGTDIQRGFSELAQKPGTAA